MVKPLLIALILSSLSTAQAAFTKAEVCGGLFLRVLDKKNLDLSGLEPDTQRAFLSMKKFRKNLLPHRNDDLWDFKDVLTHSEKASRSQMSDVAQRIRGLEVTHETNIIGPDGQTKYSATGIQLQGLEQISYFFDTMKYDADEIKKLRDLYIKKMTGHSVEHLLVKLYHPVVSYKVIQAEKFNKKFEEFMFYALSAAKSAEPGAWVYWGETAQLYSYLPAVYNTKLSSDSKVTREEMLKAQIHIEIPANRYEKEVLDAVPRSELLLDYLLHFETVDDELVPILDVFLRLETPHTRPPTKRKSKEKWEFEIDPVLQPVPIRTN